MKRIAVIGAGPVGIAAALLGVRHGFDVHVYEKEEVGAHLLQWRHVRFFTPLKNNIPEWMWEFLRPSADYDAYITGGEFVHQVLEPATQSAVLSGRVHTGSLVRGIAKRRLTRSELPGHPLRGERPFQILIQKKSGEEKIVEADIVMDASGVFDSPNWAGESGLPAPGEAAFPGRIVRHLPDFLGVHRSDWASKDILLIGNGHSAAAAAVALAEVARQEPLTRVYWVVHSDRNRPCMEVADDPLPERERVVREGNDLAERPPESWKVFRKSSLLAINPLDVDVQWEGNMLKPSGRIEAVIGRGVTRDAVRVHKILALTGYRANMAMADELQVHVSPVTGSTYGLGKVISHVSDFSFPIAVTAEQLESGEKGYYVIGHKSYGRVSPFFLRTGYQHVEIIFDRLKSQV